MTRSDTNGQQPHRDPSPDAEDRRPPQPRLAAAANLTQQQNRLVFQLRVPLYLNLGRLKARRAALAAQLQVYTTPKFQNVFLFVPGIIAVPSGRTMTLRTIAQDTKHHANCVCRWKAAQLHCAAPTQMPTAGWLRMPGAPAQQPRNSISYLPTQLCNVLRPLHSLLCWQVPPQP